MNNLKISIIIPFYNRIELLIKTIASVKNSSSNNWELILVNDHTTENIKPIKDLAYNNPKIRVINVPIGQKGGQVARNIGAKNANYELLMFLDSDDLLLPWTIENRLQFIQQNFTAEMWVFVGAEFNENTKEITRLRTIYKCKEPLKEFLSFQSVWQTSCAIWDKNAFNAIGGWNEKTKSWQDGEIYSRFLFLNGNFLWSDNQTPDVLIRFHTKDNRISNKRGLENRINLYQTHQELLQLLDGEIKKLFERNIIHSLFDTVESLPKDELKDYVNWIQTLSISKRKKHLIKCYSKWYQYLNYNNFTYRILYQIRKVGIFDKRQNFWSVRPKIDKNSEKLIKTHIF